MTISLITYPGSQLPHPTAWPVRRHELRGSQILDADAYEADHQPADIGRIDEVYLRLFEVDLESTESIMTFVNRFGILGVRRRRFREFTVFPGFLQILADFRGNWPTWVRSEYDGATEQMSYGESLDEFRFGARLLLTMTSAYRVLSGAEEREDVALESSLLKEESLADLARLLSSGLSAGLEVFHPHVQYLPHDPQEGDRATRSATPWERTPIVDPWTLYSICCLQIYNHMARSATYRNCENETCDRKFVYSKGPSESTRPRSGGLKYCSRECSRAQASRVYRRRKRAETAT